MKTMKAMLCAVALLGVGIPAWADTTPEVCYWTGEVDSDWANALNWQDDNPPDNYAYKTGADTAVFNTANLAGAMAQPALFANRSVGHVIFEDGGWTVGGSDYLLTIRGPSGTSQMESTGDNEIQPSVTHNWTVGPTTLHAGGTLTLGELSVTGGRVHPVQCPDVGTAYLDIASMGTGDQDFYLNEPPSGMTPDVTRRLVVSIAAAPTGDPTYSGTIRMYPATELILGADATSGQYYLTENTYGDNWGQGAYKITATQDVTIAGADRLHITHAGYEYLTFGGGHTIAFTESYVGIHKKINMDVLADTTFSVYGLKNDGTADRSMDKYGAGTMVITDKKGWTSTTTVYEGTLVDNAISEGCDTDLDPGTPNTMMSNLTVNAGATLAGTGTWEFAPGYKLTMNGTMAPGESVGTYAVRASASDADAAFLSATSILDAEIGESAAGDLMDIFGNIEIETGATLAVSQLDGTSASGDYPLVQFTGSRTGEFTTVTYNGAPLPPGYSLEYNANDITLVTPSALPGDTDGDGDVDINDLSTLAANWDQCGKAWADGDFTGDGCVDINDLSLLASNWGAGTAAAAQVPEPATLSVLALGGLAMLRRKRN